MCFVVVWSATALLRRVVARDFGRRSHLLTYINYWTEHSSNDPSAEVQGAAVTYYVPTGRRHDEGGTLLCSKFRLQIQNRTKPLTRVFFRGTSVVRYSFRLIFNYRFMGVRIEKKDAGLIAMVSSYF